MLKHLRNLSNTIADIELQLTETVEEILKASGHQEDVIEYTGLEAPQPIRDVFRFLVGKPSYLGGQLNTIYLLLDFLKSEVAFTVRHRQKHKVSMLHDESEFTLTPSKVSEEVVDEG